METERISTRPGNDKGNNIVNTRKFIYVNYVLKMSQVGVYYGHFVNKFLGS